MQSAQFPYLFFMVYFSVHLWRPHADRLQRFEMYMKFDHTRETIPSVLAALNWNAHVVITIYEELFCKFEELPREMPSLFTNKCAFGMYTIATRYDSTKQ